VAPATGFDRTQVYSKGKLMRGNFKHGRGYCEQARWYNAEISSIIVHFLRSAAIGGICRVPWR
jgi:hypothetical protein